MKTERTGGLEIEEDISYQRRFHVFQRMAWVVMALIITAAFTGLLGPGLAGQESVSSADGRLVVSFDRTLNYKKDSRLVLRATQAGVGPVSIWMSRTYLDAVHQKQVLPEPRRTFAAPGKVFFEFDNNGADELEITFFIQPVSIGRLEAMAGTDKSELSFSQFIFP